MNEIQQIRKEAKNSYFTPKTRKQVSAQTLQS